jgi:hypothetical protein
VQLHNGVARSHLHVRHLAAQDSPPLLLVGYAGEIMLAPPSSFVVAEDGCSHNAVYPSCFCEVTPRGGGASRSGPEVWGGSGNGEHEGAASSEVVAQALTS